MRPNETIMCHVGIFGVFVIQCLDPACWFLLIQLKVQSPLSSYCDTPWLKFSYQFGKSIYGFDTWKDNWLNNWILDLLVYNSLLTSNNVHSHVDSIFLISKASSFTNQNKMHKAFRHSHLSLFKKWLVLEHLLCSGRKESSNAAKAFVSLLS